MGNGQAPPMPDQATIDKAQAMLDHGAYLSMLTQDGSGSPNGEVSGSARRLDVETKATSKGLRAVNKVGETMGNFSFDWVLTPLKFRVAPDKRPSATVDYEPKKRQTFGVYDGSFTLGGGSFTFYGNGFTFRDREDLGNAVRIAAAGPILKSTGGNINGLAGVYTASGSYSPDDGVTLQWFVRLNDDSGKLLAKKHLPGKDLEDLEHGNTYIYVRTLADPARSFLNPDPTAPPPHVKAAEDITLFKSTCTVRENGRVRNFYEIGEKIGQHDVALTFVKPPPGTLDDPVRFESKENFHYDASVGGGALEGPVLEGQAYDYVIPGFPEDVIGIQYFTALGKVKQGEGTTGPFARMRGSLLHNLGIGTFAPHLTAIIYMLDLYDPKGHFRA